MNREIKFRGISLDTNEWVYGCLVDNLWYYSENSKYPSEKVREIIIDDFSVDDYEDIQEKSMNISVNPKSVGQFTGLKDKNDVDIYEGDILQTCTDKAMVVSWSKKYASFVLNREGWVFSHWFGESCDPEDCICIGNIHQHPHLLESEVTNA